MFLLHGVGVMLERVRRGWIQFLSAVFFNLPFLSVYLKHVPVPVLHCYACPLAAGACPIGTLQFFLVSGQIPFLTLGLLALFGLLLGRFFCGYLCPFGFLQDLLFKITKKEKRLPRWFGYGKYLTLALLVVVMPWLLKEPLFCKICPAGTLEAGVPIVAQEYIKERKSLRAPDTKTENFSFPGLEKAPLEKKSPRESLVERGSLKGKKELKPLFESTDFLQSSTILGLIGWFFYFKLLLLFLFLSLALFIKRPFCQICPLGAIFSFFNKITVFRRKKYTALKCKSCNLCVPVCPAGLNPKLELNSTGCLKCYACQAGSCAAIENDGPGW